MIFDNGVQSFTHASRRAARRAGNLAAFTKGEVLRFVASCTSVAELAPFEGLEQKKVKRAINFAKNRINGFAAALLEVPSFDVQPHPVLSEPTYQGLEVTAEAAPDAIPGAVEEVPAPPVLSEFDVLVERFRAEGKPDPVKSARASIASKASAAKRKAAKEAQLES